MTQTPPALRLVAGLLDAIQLFELIEGAGSAPAREALSHLTSLQLREPVREWYRIHDDKMHPTALLFRARLESLIGESLA